MAHCTVAPVLGENPLVSADQVQALLRKTWSALAPGGVVYVLDMMTDPSHTAPKFSALFAVKSP